MSMSYDRSGRFQPDKPLPVENPFSTAASTPTAPIGVTFQRAEVQPAPSRAPAGEAGDTATSMAAYIGQARSRELAELRAHFNKPSQGGWGIIYDPFQACWIGVRGKHVTVYASSAEELRNRIISGCWVTFPVMK
jgi:hypothetical protein